MNDDDKDIDRADAPFLNRFEKHYIQLESVLTQSDLDVLEGLQEWVIKLLSLKTRKNDMQLMATNVFPNYSYETLGLIVLKNRERFPDDDEELLVACKREMIAMATEDIILFSYVGSV